jgi:hypothetical protein
VKRRSEDRPDIGKDLLNPDVSSIQQNLKKVKQFYVELCSIHLNEGNHHARAWAVRWDEDLLANQRGAKIVDLESNVGHSLDGFRIGSIIRRESG